MGMIPRDRDGSFTHTHGVMPLLPTGVKKVKCGIGVVPQKTLLSFPDVPKMQTLNPLKSQKREGFWTVLDNSPTVSGGLVRHSEY